MKKQNKRKNNLSNKLNRSIISKTNEKFIIELETKIKEPLARMLFNHFKNDYIKIFKIYWDLCRNLDEKK